MADVKFKLKDIEALAAKLSALEQFLTRKDRDLLVAIFAAAAGRIEVSDPAGRTGGTLPATQTKQSQEPGPGPGPGGQDPLSVLQQQLLNSYIPGEAPNHPGETFKDRITG
jgi:hypothetical protein